ncbi:MAG: hypothetical protein WBV46_18090, partial [Terriglobales bacterium]
GIQLAIMGFLVERRSLTTGSNQSCSHEQPKNEPVSNISPEDLRKWPNCNGNLDQLLMNMAPRNAAYLAQTASLLFLLGIDVA